MSVKDFTKKQLIEALLRTPDFLYGEQKTIFYREFSYFVKYSLDTKNHLFYNFFNVLDSFSQEEIKDLYKEISRDVVENYGDPDGAPAYYLHKDLDLLQKIIYGYALYKYCMDLHLQ